MFTTRILSTICGAVGAAAFVSQTPVRGRASKLGQVPEKAVVDYFEFIRTGAPSPTRVGVPGEPGSLEWLG